MRRPVLLLSALLTASALSSQYSASASTSTRQVTRIDWFGRSGSQRLSIDYCAGKWRPQFEASLPPDTDQSFYFLGAGTWTVLDTGVDLHAGNRTLPSGRWYLGVHRDAAGAWTLGFRSPAKIDAANRPGSRRVDTDPELHVPMRFARVDDLAETFTISLAVDRKVKKNVTITLAWGPFRLHGDLVAGVDDRLADGAPAFAPTPASRRTTTASGLQYEQLRAGAGAFPKPDSTVTLHYTGWLEDGTPFDTSYLRGEPATLRLQQVVKGFAEGLLLMQPGATFQFTIPPALAYGEHGAGQDIPPNATLVFQVTLVAIAD